MEEREGSEALQMGCVRVADGAPVTACAVTQSYLSCVSVGAHKYYLLCI